MYGGLYVWDLTAGGLAPGAWGSASGSLGSGCRGLGSRRLGRGSGLWDLDAGRLDPGICEAGSGGLWGSSGGSLLGKEPRNTKLDGRPAKRGRRDVRGRPVDVPWTCRRVSEAEWYGRTLSLPLLLNTRRLGSVNSMNPAIGGIRGNSSGDD